MKRRASRVLGGHPPAKLTKESTKLLLDDKLTSLKRKDTQSASPQEPARSSSFRQRKAPSWLSSYVTNASQEKEIKQTEKPKLKIPRFPTLIPPSKRGKEDLKGAPKEKKDSECDTVTPSLRKQPTLKLDSTSPPVSSVKDKKPLIPTPSLLRKPTKVLNATDDLKSKFEWDDSNEDVKSVENKKKATISDKKRFPKSLSKHVKLRVPKSTVSKSPTQMPPPKPGKKASISRVVGKNIKEDTVTDDSKVVEICDPLNNSNSMPPPLSTAPTIPATRGPPVPLTNHKAADQTFILNDQSQPSMLEVVICISTSGALREYLTVLQDNIREMIWRLQSLVPNLRIGVMAHTQGGIHDDPVRGSFSAGDHNYNRTGGHGGTKWLDLGATMSQICAFVDSLESEPTLYPDYVQDNLEMALWKLQRCMSWSSCSYRSVIMIGRGRPNRTTFYLQKEHWRGWIRSALELPPKFDIPVIDWELEAKLLAEMGIHVFTIQATAENNLNRGEEDEGTCFFRRVAELTQAQHVRITSVSKLPEIMVGIFCACHGSDLLLEHRDSVRDENDGLLPTQLTEIFVGLQLHSKSNSLSSLPSMLRNLDLSSMRQRLNGYSSRVDSSMDFEASRVENSMELADIKEEEEMESAPSPVRGLTKMKSIRRGNSKSVPVNKKVNGFKEKLKVVNSPRSKPYDVKPRKSELKVKGGGVKKNDKVLEMKSKKTVTKAIKAVTKVTKTPDRSRDNSLGMRVGRELGKRKIKVSEKLRESMLSAKKGGVTKAQKKKSNVSPLKREAVKAAIKSQLQTKERSKMAASSQMVKSKVGKAKKVIQSKSKQELNGKRRKPYDVGNRSTAKLNGKRQGKDGHVENESKKEKVSPLKRKKSLPKSPMKTTLSKDMTVRHKLSRKSSSSKR